MSTPTAAVSKATSRECAGLAVLALPCVLYSMDLTVLNLAVPKISAALRPTNTELLWIAHLPELSLISLIHPNNTNSINLAKAVGAYFEKDYEFRGDTWSIYRHTHQLIAVLDTRQ